MASYKKAYFDLIAENDKLIVGLNTIKDITNHCRKHNACNKCCKYSDQCNGSVLETIVKVIKNVSNNNQQ